jgi:hypothetical protein
MEDACLPFLNACKTMPGFLAATLGAGVLFALIARHIPAFPEPELPVKTPFGKLPFFDGVVLYGVVILLLLGLAYAAPYQG